MTGHDDPRRLPEHPTTAPEEEPIVNDEDRTDTDATTAEVDAPPARTPRRRVDLLSLAAGLLYVLVATAALVGVGPGMLRVLRADLLLPGLLVLAGLLILASLRGGGRRA
ncbi:MAG: hypothetical protein ACLGIR_08820 [Actinomycetes bacterium]